MATEYREAGIRSGGDRIGDRILDGGHQNIRWQQNIGRRASEYLVVTEYRMAGIRISGGDRISGGTPGGTLVRFGMVSHLTSSDQQWSGAILSPVYPAMLCFIGKLLLYLRASPFITGR